MNEAFVPEATRESPRNEHDNTSMNGDIDDKHQSSLISPNVQDIDDDIGMSDQQDEPLTPTFTLTNGKSIGLQITLTKAADLSPNTVLLDITSDDTVTQTIWRPADPTTLVVAGDHFCGLWKWHGQRTSHHSSLDMLVNDPLKQTYVTALNWNPTGEMLAVATYRNMTGSVTMYNRDGSAIDLLPDLPRMITGLHWAPGGQQMMVVASDGERSEISLWNQNIRSDVFPFQRVVEGNMYAVSWAGDDFIYASSDSSIYNFSIKHNNVDSTRTYSSENKESWVIIKSMVLDRPLAVAVSNQTSKIWVPTHEIIQEGIHDGDITSLEIYSKAPLNTSDTKNSFVLAATSSMDNTIKLWKIGLYSKRIDCLHKLSLGPYSPALVTTISPDSYAVASVSNSKLLIWNVDRGGTAIAKWNMPVNENEYDHDRMSDNDSYIPFDRSLSWDTDGKKLALGFGHKVELHCKITSVSRTPANWL